MKLVYVIVACILLQACATVGSVDRPASYYQENSTVSQEGLVASAIFGDDDNKINE